MTNRAHKQTGFTIVELGIVVIVIAILAAIMIVGYRGIQKNANDVAVMSDLESFSAVMAGATYVDGIPIIGDGTPGVPSFKPLEDLKWSASKDSYNTSVDRNVVFCYNYTLMAVHADWGTLRNGRTNWALVALSKSGSVFYVTDQQSVPQKYTKSTPMVFDTTELICGVVISELGAPGFTSVFHGYNKSDTTTGPWRSWAAGS